MARFLVKASEFKNVCKAVNDRKLAELKKEIIEILKKQDEKEVKKAVDYFNSQELHYTHLEKSINGKWIEKAGYGVGTVRIWKGKKYKKIAPGKWARVFEKEGRGTNIAIGKLIAKVQKIDNVEDLMAFVMANKQRFVDENGMDLPVLDKLRAAVDARNGNVGSKETAKKKEESDADRLKRRAEYNYGDWSKKDLESELENLKDKAKEGFNVDDDREQINYILENKDFDEESEAEKKDDEDPRTGKESYWIQDIRGNRLTNSDAKKRVINNSKKIADLNEQISNMSKADAIRLNTQKRELEAQNTYLMDRLNLEDRKEIESEAEKKTDDSKAYEGKLATQKQVDEATAISNKYEVSRNEMLKKPITTIQKYANSTVEDFEGGIDKFIEYMAEGRSEGVSMDVVGKEFAKLINHNVARKIWDDYKSGALVPDDKGILKPKEESEAEKPSKKEEKQYKETKKMLEDKIAEFDKQLKMFDNNPNENTERLSKDVEKQKKTYVKMLENLESEYEKTQNRSDAMKGNKNAYKDGLDKDLIRNANGSSNMYEPGDAIEREFKGGLKAIDMWNLSDEEKEKAKQKLFELSTEELKAQSGAISVTAAGPARTVKGADKKFEKVQKVRGEKQALLNELREKSRKADNQEETKKVVNSAADAIKENKLSFISEGKLYYRGNTKSKSWTVIDKIPELKDDDSIETKKNQLKELNAKSKNLGFADSEKAKVLENINRLKNEIAYMNTDNYKLSKEGVEKSLFDDFVIDMFIDDEIEDDEELKEGETEYNDYSAEQPELFNSTTLKVQEAFNRCNKL